MRIAVFGATGGIGKAFIQAALTHRHQVQALIRSGHAPMEQEGVQFIVGDATHIEDVARTIVGCDAVLCALGAKNEAGTTIREVGTRQIVHALSASKQAAHLVVISSLGVGNSKQQMAIPIRWIVRYILRHALADHQKQESIVIQSQLEWTILRPTGLSDEAAQDNLRVSYPPTTVSAQPSVTRADVAHYALNSIENHSSIGKIITLTAQQ